MNRELQRLISRGCGLSAEDISHPGFGVGIWKYSFDGCEIVIFDRGLVILSDATGDKVEVSFADIIGVHSSLNAKIISEASASHAFDMLLPLRLDLRGRQVELNVPLVVYSAILITIQEGRLS